MKKIRDMSQAQFDAATEKLGFRRLGFLGYYNLPPPFQNTSVSKFNAGENRRAQLAYLVREHEAKKREVKK